MTRSVIPARLSPSSTRTAARTAGPGQLTIPTKRSRGGRSRSKLPRMSELAIDTGDNGRLIDLNRELDAATRPPGCPAARPAAATAAAPAARS
ncbi:hypothetical protein [Streptomyces sp. NPDC006691]|uniref:hypothetical protein n=1 Tax=Streptomyces sp. NPDC006691 TaxID=3364757 RepID=UPI0036D03865